MIPREQLERWKTLHKPTLVFLGEVCEAVPALISEVEAQAKEIERLRAALTNIAAGGCVSPEPCATHGKGALWCDACIARAALKETP